MAASQQTYTFDGVELPASAFNDSGFYSFGTRKIVKGASRAGRFSHTYMGKIHVYGTLEELRTFETENNIPENKRYTHDSPKAKPSASIKAPKPKSPKREEVKAPLSPSVFVLSDDITDVERIPESFESKLTNFNFKGLQGKGKITRIIDGDTMCILVFIEIPTLAMGHEHKAGRGKNSKVVREVPILTSLKRGGFFANFKVRLLGLDTAEKNTEEGQLAKKLTEDRYAELRNIVYYVFEGFDKYGRLLASFYADPEHTDNLNQLLVNKKFNINGEMKTIALYYDGGTKSDYMKQLPTHPKGKAGKGAAEGDEPPLKRINYEDSDEDGKRGEVEEAFLHKEGYVPPLIDEEREEDIFGDFEEHADEIRNAPQEGEDEDYEEYDKKGRFIDPNPS